MSIAETDRTSSVSVVIATAGRPDILHDTIQSLYRQSIAPFEIIVCLPDYASIRPSTAAVSKVIESLRGLCPQRNAGLKAVRGEYTLFLDDDIELPPDYMKICLRIMQQNPHIALVGGWAFIEGTGRAEALELIAKEAAIDDSLPDCVPAFSCYGCNMFVRSDIARRELFDENLPLYGWLEDYDWSRRIAKHGAVAWSAKARVVHLRTPSGRTDSRLFGYSQIANPLYLYHKGTMPGRKLVSHWAGSLAGNLRHLRKSHLRGNSLALWDFVCGRIHPRRILAIS
jgi:glycosyltransferase involved in cell wall biosynthesis